MAFKMIYPLKYEVVVEKYSKEYNLDKELIYAIIKTESGFNEKAKSSKNAFGLMQITEETLEWLSTKTPENDSELTANDLYDKETNLRLGCFLLRLNLDYYKDEKTAICAYNAGRSRVDKWLADSKYSKNGKTLDEIPFEETKNYVQKVHDAKEMYNKLYFNK